VRDVELRTWRPTASEGEGQHLKPR
jgi:hypothetical protein